MFYGSVSKSSRDIKEENIKKNADSTDIEQILSLQTLISSRL